MNQNNLQIYLVRHGQTEWSASGRHTGLTDIPLTERGQEQARALKSRLQGVDFQAIYCSPLLRARETCALAGFADRVILESDAVEWNYGAYEGLTRGAIEKQHPAWNVFLHGAPGGESPDQATLRAERLIAKFLPLQGPIALFAHGHLLRLLATRWIDLQAAEGRHFSLSVASVSLLGFEFGHRALRLWNSNV